MTALLRVRDLRVTYGNGVRALGGINLDLHGGESLAVIGESGAGKSTLTFALAGLSDAPSSGGTVDGSIRLHGTELIGAPPDHLRTLRGERIGLLVQAAPLNPVRTLGDLIAEPLRVRRRMGVGPSTARVRALLTEVGLDPDVLGLYPHQVSGGQRRRAALALALALDPDLLILDEPTGGLDTVTADTLAGSIGTLVRERGVGLLTITHSLSDVARLADRTMVLYGGQALEIGRSADVLREPRHPYTRDLADAYPTMSTTRDLRPIRGLPPDPAALPSGCPYHPRCPQAVDRCSAEPVTLAPTEPRAADPGVPTATVEEGRWVACHLGGVATVLEARGVGRTYGNDRARTGLRAASLQLRSGEALGVVGRSGSGKSTLASILAGHLRPETGYVLLGGRPFERGRRRDRSTLRQVQLIQQDPSDAVSPRFTVAELLTEPLRLAGEHAAVDAALAGALRSVGLPDTPGLRTSRAHQLSGGQLQRLCVARALLAQPRVLVADEPTSMLDPSEQARLLLTMRERQSELGLGLILISHDLALVRKACDRLLVLDDGVVVEQGSAEAVCATPSHDTTRRLLAAAPVLPPTARQEAPPTDPPLRKEGRE